MQAPIDCSRPLPGGAHVDPGPRGEVGSKVVVDAPKTVVTG